MDFTLKNTLPLLEIHRYLGGGKVFTVVIDGKCGVGKSTLAKKIKEYLDTKQLETYILPLDGFIRPKKYRTFYSTPEDYDLNRVVNEVLIPLKNGDKAIFYLYDWDSDSFKTKTLIELPAVLIIEGVNSCDELLKDYLDFTIFLNLDKQTRNQRVLKRGDFTQKEFETWSETEDEIFKKRDIENYYDLIYKIII